MSKLSKLMTKPDKFFIDMVKKRSEKKEKLVTSTNKMILSKENQQKSNMNKAHSKPATITPKQPPVTIATKKAPVTMIIDNMRLFNKTAHLLHSGEGVNCSFHLELWVGEFIASGEKFAILLRNIELYKWAISKYPYLDIVYAKTALDVENVLTKLPYLKAIYYFSNTGNLIHSLRFNIYQHIFLGHGDSDKAASAHKFFRVYDEIWVAGQAHIDRFKNAGFSVNHIKFVKVGRPNLKQIVKRSVEKKDRIQSVQNLTYFPTWEGAFEENNYSSAHLSIITLSEIQRKLNCNIQAKYHPLTGQRDKTLLQVYSSLEREFLDRPYMLNISDKTTPVENLINNSNAFVCDISAVVSECISALAPIFIYIPADRKIVTSSSDMQYSDYAYVYSSVPELLELVDKVLIDGNDYLANARFKALDYLLSIEETVNDEFQNQLKRLNNSESFKENFRELAIQ